MGRVNYPVSLSAVTGEHDPAIGAFREVFISRSGGLAIIGDRAKRWPICTKSRYTNPLRAAGQHIQRQIQGSINSWLKASLIPPFLEHLSFRLGNQLFFVRVEDVEGRLEVPGTREGLLMIARECKGHACIMPMREKAGTWSPKVPGWGLVDAHTGEAIDPVTLISDEKIEMTDWEVQDFAVQIVRDQLNQTGRELMSWQGNPQVDPSIWFVKDTESCWLGKKI